MHAQGIADAKIHAVSAAEQQRSEARRVAEQFEGIFVQTMVRDLRRTATAGGEGGGMFGDGPGADTYGDWFDQHLTTHISKHGRVGVADVLMREFERSKQIPAAPPKEIPTVAVLGSKAMRGGIDVHV